MSEQPLNLPSNSILGRQQKPKLEQVTTDAVVIRKKGFLARMSGSLIAENKEGIFQVIVTDVLVNGLKNVLVDAVSTFSDSVTLAVKKAVLGESANPGVRFGRPTPYYAISRAGGRPQTPAYTERVISQRARAHHDFGEIILSTRGQAEDILDALRLRISEYGAATVPDLYDLVGLSDRSTDYRYGWTDLQFAGVRPVRGGYMIVLPRTELLD
jgi:hypothetical protein